MQKKDILIDVGSSTVKVYQYLGDNKIKLLQGKSIYFKDHLDEFKGLTEEATLELISYVNDLKISYETSKIRVFATALFRKFSAEIKRNFIHRFFKSTGLYFNIISQELENFYLEKACIDKCPENKNILILNIGGASLELVVLGVCRK